MKTKSKYTIGNFKLRVRRAASGKGLFTENVIPKGACIIEYIGRPASFEEMVRDSGKYLFWADKLNMINGNIPANTARYINHSCAANCEADGPPGRIFILARRAIKAGEELTYDYGEEYFDKHIKPKGCRCITCMAKPSLSRYTPDMSQPRVRDITPRKSHSRKTKARLARKAEMLKRLVNKRNRVHRRKRSS